MSQQRASRSEMEFLTAALPTALLKKERLSARLRALILRRITRALSDHRLHTTHSLPSSFMAKVLLRTRRGSVNERLNLLALLFETHEDLLFVVLNKSMQLRRRLIYEGSEVDPKLGNEVFMREVDAFAENFFDSLPWSRMFDKRYQKDKDMVAYGVKHAENFYSAIRIFNRDSDRIDGAPPPESLAAIIKSSAENGDYFQRYVRRVRQHGPTEYQKYFGDTYQKSLRQELEQWRQERHEEFDDDEEMSVQSDEDIYDVDLPSETEELLETGDVSPSDSSDPNDEETEDEETDDEEIDDEGTDDDKESEDEETKSVEEDTSAGR